MRNRRESAPAIADSRRAHNRPGTESGSALAPATRSETRRIVQELLRNRAAVIGLIVLILIIIAALTAPLIAPYHPHEQNLVEALQSPSGDHLMGTDEFGRDIFSRILHGASISLRIGLLAVAVACLIGIPVGLCAAYYQGWLDTISLRLVDALLAFPDILLALVVLTILGPSITSVTIGVGVAQIPAFVRLTRASTLTVRELDYVSAGHVIGASTRRIIFRHILPNAAAPLIVLASVTVGAAILVGSGLSFLGLGAQPPTPEWGSMLISSRLYMRDAPWIAIFPGGAIMLTVFAINMFGDGLRDALDARLRIQ